MRQAFNKNYFACGPNSRLQQVTAVSSSVPLPNYSVSMHGWLITLQGHISYEGKKFDLFVERNGWLIAKILAEAWFVVSAPFKSFEVDLAGLSHLIEESTSARKCASKSLFDKNTSGD